MTQHTVFLHDTQTGTKKPSPDHQTISFYACGITPYSAAHVGHARSFVLFDAMVKLFQGSGYNVNFVRNITDIDDKIIAEASKSGQEWSDVSDFWAEDNRKHMSTLLCDEVKEPKASDYIDGMISIIQTLLDKGFAYVADNGDVLFRHDAYKGQGLSQVDIQGAPKRVASEHKHSVQDFVLWKMSKPGEPFFESPWGAGRPGWHIECSSMIKEILGTTIDYHGGGVDLRFPHHHAEVLQSECAHGAPLARHWLHHGSVRDGLGQKMSKSLGNVVLISDALKTAEEISGSKNLAGIVLRLSLMSALWTKPLDYSDETLKTAWQDITLFVGALLDFDVSSVPEKDLKDSRSYALLRDNFNTPKLRAFMHAVAKKTEPTHEDLTDLLAGLYAAGFTEQTFLLARDYLKSIQNELSEDTLATVREMEAERARLRALGKFLEADILRDKLKEMGFSAKDGSLSSAKPR